MKNKTNKTASAAAPATETTGDTKAPERDAVSDGALEALDSAFEALLNSINEAGSSDKEQKDIPDELAPDYAEDTIPTASSGSLSEAEELFSKAVAAASSAKPVIPDLIDTMPVVPEEERADVDPAVQGTEDPVSPSFHVKHSSAAETSSSEAEKDDAGRTSAADTEKMTEETGKTGTVSGVQSEKESGDNMPGGKEPGGKKPEEHASAGSEPDTEALHAAGDPFRAPEETNSGHYRNLGLYLHIPFCRSKCAYCDFFSTDKIVCQGHRAPQEMKDYCEALKNQMKFFSERTAQYNVDTVFIGGGTPTALPEKLLLDIVREVQRDFYMEDGFEFTVEMNPATAEIGYLKKLRKAGVNRLSIGMQSSNNHELAALSRIHTVGDFAMSFQMAREAGFDNINIDVMFGIPEQTVQSFQETLEFVCGMKPEHISMYNLRIEDGTPFGEKRHMLPLPDEDAECAMYFDGIAYLAERGYRQYEISNFAKEGKECRHNLRYWHGEEYIGCGPAAHSYFGGRRFSLKHTLDAYSKALASVPKQLPLSLLDENYVIDRREELAEYLMLRLRLTEGISVTDFYVRFGADFERYFAPKLKVYLENGFMRRTETADRDARYAFTPKGMFVSNYILARIIPFEPKYSSSASVLGGGGVE